MKEIHCREVIERIRTVELPLLNIRECLCGRITAFYSISSAIFILPFQNCVPRESELINMHCMHQAYTL